MKRLSFSLLFYFPMLPSVNCRWQHFFTQTMEFEGKFKKQVLVKSKQKPAYIYYGGQPLCKGNLLKW